MANSWGDGRSGGEYDARMEQPEQTSSKWTMGTWLMCEVVFWIAFAALGAALCW